MSTSLTCTSLTVNSYRLDPSKVGSIKLVSRKGEIGYMTLSKYTILILTIYTYIYVCLYTCTFVYMCMYVYLRLNSTRIKGLRDGLFT